MRGLGAATLFLGLCLIDDIADPMTLAALRFAVFSAAAVFIVFGL